jgi:hypothetical protein
MMWPFKKTRITIVAENGKSISVDHNQSTSLDLKIESHGVANVVVSGNKETSVESSRSRPEVMPSPLPWFQRPVGILFLTVISGVISAVVAAGIVTWLGWK